jgi:hypothetical protein
MKRIKLFESFDKSEYFQNLNSDEMDWDTIYFDFLTEKDLNVIWDLASQKDCQFEIQEQPRTNKPNYRVEIHLDDIHVSIRALRDEWFLVEVINSMEFPRHTVFYKCDQLEGLLECLKEILYID